MAQEASRMLLTGVPPYRQSYVKRDNGDEIFAGCGPVAALAVMAYYQRRYGYTQLIPPQAEREPGMPRELIFDLRDKMQTVTVTGKQGLTFPHAFMRGLKGYLKQFHHNVSVSTRSTIGFGTSESVFRKSVSLIQQGKVHCLLFDWKGESGLFPNHYVVVVGYRQDSGHREMIINNGWGQEFQIVDLSDRSVLPLRIYWLDFKQPAPTQANGRQIGPQGHYHWVEVNGSPQLQPKLLKHFSGSETVEWPASAQVESLVADSDLKACRWFDA